MKSNFSHKVLGTSAIIWIAIVISLGAYLLHEFQSRPSIFATDLYSLLPRSDRNNTITGLIERVSKTAENQFFVLLENSSRERLSEAASLMEESLYASNTLQNPAAPESYAVDAVASVYARNFKALLSYDDVKNFHSASDFPAYMEGLKENLFSPFFNPLGISLANDPLLIANRKLLRMSELIPARDENGRLLVATTNGGIALISHFIVNGSPFSGEVQDQVFEAYEKGEKILHGRFPEIHVAPAGLVWISRATSNNLQAEVSLLNLISFVGSFVLFAFVFRSIGALLLTLIPLVSGVILAVSVSLMIFPTLHVITVGFGSILVGGCTDYGVHYLTSHAALPAGRRSGLAVLREVFSGLTLGMITSVAAFSAFLFTPLPALVQVAVFSAGGLIGAYVTVITLFPFVAPRFVKQQPQRDLSSITLSGVGWAYLRIPAILAGTVITITGLAILTANDDVRLLSRVDPHLLEVERRLSTLTKGFDPGRFVLVEGPDEGSVLQREEDLRKNLPAQSSVGLTDLIPSPFAGHESIAAVKSICDSQAQVLKTYSMDIGLPADSIETLCRNPSEYSPRTMIDELQKSHLAEAVNLFWLGASPHGFATVIRLRDSGAAAGVLSKLPTLPGISYIDRIKDAGLTLAIYRIRATYVTLASYALILVLLLIRYGWKRTIALAIPPVAGAVVALGVLGVTGGSLNLFSVFGVLITLGLGIDFTLFIEEARDHREAARTGVITSALTSIFAFGLLAFSSTPMLNQFGISVSVGIFVAMLLAPLTAGRRSA